MAKPKRKPPTHTNLGMCTSAIRKNLWLRSPERRDALKIAGYSCERCGVKQSVAKGREVKVDVHHKNGIPKKAWALLYRIVKKYITPSPENIEVLCVSCHKKEHGK